MFGLFKKNSVSIIQTSAIKNFITQFAQEDNWHNLDLQSGNLGYGWLHYALIRNLKPAHVLCIGSRYGFIPAVCAQACKDNCRGTVDFVDAGYDENKNEPNHWGGFGVWKKISPKKYFAPFGLAPYLNLHVQTSQQFATSYSQLTYEYIHLDGDHSYEGVKKDFDTFWPKLNPSGFMAFHDIHTPDDIGKLSYGVRQFWQELKQSKQHHLIELPGTFGLGIIQKLP